MSGFRRSLLLQVGAAAGGVLCAVAAVDLLDDASDRSMRPRPPAGFVVERRGPTTVFAPSTAEARQAQDEAQYARTRFAALFGTEAPELAIVLVAEPRHLDRIDLTRLHPRGGLLLPFLTLAALGSTPGSGASGSVDEENGRDRKLLAHEACHGYVAALADELARRPRARGDHYGHPSLPDWFEEAVAILCESESGRAARRRYFRQRLDQRVPLATFTKLPHPLAGIEVRQKLGIGEAREHPSIEILTAERIHELLPGSDPMMFYAQALSLGEFIEAQVGAGGMHIVARSLVKSADLAEVLPEIRLVLPALPATIEALEEAWIRWVAADSR